MDRKREDMGYEWERLKHQNNNKIKLDRHCVECGKVIPPGTISAKQMEFSIKNGTNCKECMEKKTRFP